jgi:hypothetical protein
VESVFPSLCWLTTPFAVIIIIALIFVYLYAKVIRFLYWLGLWLHNFVYLLCRYPASHRSLSSTHTQNV